jgi:imidazole glycerol-phosphate synthase subunit HisH
MVVGIVNYGVAGNIYSIKKAVEKAGGKTLIISHPNHFNLVDKIILPGVGSFKDAMNELTNNGFIELLRNSNKPILGICLGMQILAKLGFEYGETQGLDLVDAEVRLIQCEGKVPHMGFNKLQLINCNPLLEGLRGEEFYFMHSYEMCNCIDIAALTEYEKHNFVSVICKGSVYGVQFHPEKSREAGIRLLSNFIKLKV